MKKLLIVLATVLMSTACLVTTSTAAVEVEGDVYAGYYDKYLWRGFDLSSSKHVLQPGMDVSFKGLTLSYWSNIQLDDGELSETDITVDYSFDVTDLVSLSVGNIYYNLSGDKDVAAITADTNELYLGVGLNTLLSPTVTAYWDYDQAEADGLYFTFAVGHSIKTCEAFTLNLGALVSYNQSSDYAVANFDDFHNYELSIGGDLAVTDQISISPSFLYSSGISDESKALIDSETLGGITVTLTF
ncbi:hypothetical protein DESUT3_16490 [Desulfuromonas versatilis]|uniref:Uncharacterized protein n=1 Tax=Desulfuromonas versatilis TaxID=2802975 RepID=A0ABM8HVN3_9BACT|nr:TorF family putative porin [Desulfuromonas versatilis]BCR04580.1 hypothetical protein DESUT3_16490 [Desulfuromonas versatilis]